MKNHFEILADLLLLLAKGIARSQHSAARESNLSKKKFGTVTTDQIYNHFL